MSAQTVFKRCKMNGNTTVNTAGRNINIDESRTVNNASKIQNNNFNGAIIKNSTTAVMGNMGTQEVSGSEEICGSVEQSKPREKLYASLNSKQEQTEHGSDKEPGATTVFEDCEIGGNPNFNTAKQDININRSTKEYNNSQEQTNNFGNATIENSTVGVIGNLQKGTTSQHMQDRNVPAAIRPAAQKQVTNAQGAIIKGSIFGVMGNVTENSN